jgi:UDP-N-acetyl-2-amino-2-deoxyglucuronate dehydrogenase
VKKEGSVLIHVGIVGAGNISQTHARAASAIQGVVISAVHGANAGKAGELASTYGAAAYDDLDAFLRHDPLDLVIIGSPSGVHAEQGIAAARRGKHVLVEKPIDITAERADALIAQCEAAGVRLGVLFQDRLKPGIVPLKHLVESGGLGRILHVIARVPWYRPPDYYRLSRWRGTRALDGGGALMNQGIHTVDLLLWLVGDVARVQARTATLLHQIESEDTALALLEFAGGAVGVLEATTAAFPGYPRRLELRGSEGTVVLEHDRIVAADLRTPRPDLVQVRAAGAESASSPVVSDAGPHQRMIEDFLRAVETGSRPVCDGHEGRRSVELVEAIYRSARSLASEPVGVHSDRRRPR